MLFMCSMKPWRIACQVGLATMHDSWGPFVCLTCTPSLVGHAHSPLNISTQGGVTYFYGTQFTCKTVILNKNCSNTKLISLTPIVY